MGLAPEAASQLEEKQASVDQFDAANLEDVWTFHEHFFPDVAQALRIGIPMVISSSAKLVQALIISIMLGRKDTILLAAVSTSTIWTDIVDQATRGGAGQIGLLCSQALGARKFSLVGVWLQMALVLVTIMYLPFATLKVATGSVLSFLGVPAILSEPAGTFAIITAPALIFELYFAVTTEYFHAQGIVGPDMVLQLLFIPIASVLVYVFVFVYPMGVYGVAIVWSTKRVLKLFSYVGVTWYMGYHKKTWSGFNLKEVFIAERWSILLGMCIPAAIGSIAEVAVLSINSAFAARLGPASSAAFDLLTCLTMLLYGVVWGMCQAFALLMARRLGEGRPKAALGMVKAGASIVVAVVWLVAALLYWRIELFAELGSYDPAVREQVVSLRLVGALGMAASGSLYLVVEVLIKQGRVGLVVLTLGFFNWLVGIPISFFATPHLGLVGIQLGSTTAYLLSFAVLTTYLLKSDWVQIAKTARRNAGVSGASVDNLLEGKAM